MLAYGSLAEAVGTAKAAALVAGEPIDDDALELGEELLPRSAVLADPSRFGGGEIG